MANAALPEDVLAFLRQNINSVEQLEILLLVRCHPDQRWTALDVSKEMRSAPLSAATRLVDLAHHGLVDREEGPPESFRYLTANAKDAAIGLLAVTYAERRHAVIEAIFAQPLDRIRMFADAFRFRRKPEDGSDG